MSNDTRESHRKALVEAYYQVNRSYDRDTLFVAAGGITLSLSLISKFMDNQQYLECPILIKISLFLFVASVALILLRHYSGIKLHYKAIVMFDKGEKYPTENDGWKIVADSCFTLLITFLAFGLVMAVIFAVQNMEGGLTNVY